MILLAGIPSEPPLRLVIEAAEEANIPYILLNQRETQYSELAIRLVEGQIRGTLRLRDVNYALEGFSGVYVRLMDHQHLPGMQRTGVLANKEPNIDKTFVFHELLLAWLDVADCRVMNRGIAMASNISKPYQAQLITQSGFQTPRTLITNTAENARLFLLEHKPVIFKSISSIRSIVQELSGAKVDDLKNIRYLPTQFQAFVPGINIRVHVVGDVLFATEIRSEAVDYRYASRDGIETDMIPTCLPAEIESRCFALSKLLALPLCGIDLKLTPEGEYFCFEVNPSPGYSYFQETSGQNIARAIVDYLEFGSARTVRDVSE